VRDIPFFWYYSYYCKMIRIIQIAMEKLAPHILGFLSLCCEGTTNGVSLDFWSQLGNIILPGSYAMGRVILQKIKTGLSHQHHSPNLQSLIVFDRSPVYVLLSCVLCCFVVHIIFAFPSSSTLFIQPLFPPPPHSPRVSLHKQIR
jgi:hypothetical protein